MAIDERNYWFTYITFLKQFKSLQYHGYPIALFSHYFRNTTSNHRVINYFKENSATQYINLQKEFVLNEPRMISNSKPKSSLPIGFYDHLLRLPKKQIVRQFEQGEIIWLSKKTLVKESYIKSIHAKRYQEQAKVMFKSIEHHPILGDPAFQKYFLNEIPMIIASLIAAMKLIEQNPMKALVIGTTNELKSRVLTYVARRNGIPTVCLQHGIIASPLGYLPKVADHLVVYSSYEQDLYKQYGVNPSTVHPLGHPRFDPIMNMKRSKRSQNPKRKQPIILLICHHEQFEQTRTIINKLERQGYDLILKPRTSLKKLRKEIRPSKHIVINNKAHLHELIARSDCVISYESTVVLEAMLFNKPVFIWKSEQLIPVRTFESIGAFFYEEAGKIANHVISFFQDGLKAEADQVRQDYIKDHYFSSSASSLNELVKLLKRTF
ncbi:hypothetical protein [Alkalibacillus silvisoli]|uniref:CDP-glycerol glycerophosphotransferase family protein n=1 Tax=Alkalibacillus silvisoli TaxID=392823 RepID=A0ABN0ZNU1_9BACI